MRREALVFAANTCIRANRGAQGHAFDWTGTGKAFRTLPCGETTRQTTRFPARSGRLSIVLVPSGGTVSRSELFRALPNVALPGWERSSFPSTRLTHSTFISVALIYFPCTQGSLPVP